MKKYNIIVISLFLLYSIFLPVSTFAQDGEEGKLSGKNEVIYATLDLTGNEKDLYVVNSLEVVEAGEVIDYGPYAALKNLTDLSELEQAGDRVTLTVPEGKFYYQGEMEETDLPWEIEITYELDGEVVNPLNLAGKDGTLEIGIKTESNDTVDSTFYENYLLQISLPFDGEKTRNIDTEDGMLANAGKDIIVTFTVMPGEPGDISVRADVEAFEMSGIDINAVPQNMSLDAPDTDEFKEDIVTLADALAEIDNGVFALESGTSSLHEGTKALEDGSRSYQEGISMLNNGSSELVSGSSSIKEALHVMSNSLGSDAEAMDLSDMKLVTAGLTELKNALSDISSGLGKLNENYKLAFDALDEAVTALPDQPISEEKLAILYQSGLDQETVDQLVNGYAAGLVAKGTYQNTKEAFTAVESTLDNVAPSLQTMADSIGEITAGFSNLQDMEDITSGIQELQDGLSALSANYNEFHQGLITYTDGVDELANGYGELNNGISELTGGTAELNQGVSELRSGTRELAEATSEMPEQITEEIDAILSQYDGSGFEPTSFVSEKNEHVNSVQFVLTTEAIEIEEEEEVEKTEAEEKSFLEKLLDLFR